jgi:hypothetical protein
MHASRSLRQFVWLSSISAHIQEWVRKEIVDDDPCDDVSYFPVTSEDGSGQMFPSSAAGLK